jgi:predicted MFS family arabinose efflux permease
MPWALIAACALGMFVASASGTTRAPFLIDMAHDLDSSVAVIANIMALNAIAWGLASFLAGQASDRFGRRPFLIGGPLFLALCVLGVAWGESYAAVAIAATLAGACAGAFTGVMMAEVSGRVVDRQRGRAMGWVMAGQSMALLVGVPMAAFLGAFIGWRGVNIVIAGIAALATLGLLRTTRFGSNGRRAAGAKPASLRAALSPRVVRLLSLGVAERLCYGLTVVYFATFLQSTYDLSVAAVAVPLALFAAGNILGTILGGQMADRLPDRMLTFAGAMLASAVVALPLFAWHPSLAVSVGLGFIYVLINALARPSLMAVLANVPDAVRGTVLGLNVTSAAFGWLGAAALGGWMLASHGFEGFGPLAAVIGGLAGGLAILGRR